MFCFICCVDEIQIQNTAIPDRCSGKHGKYDQIKIVFVVEKG